MLFLKIARAVGRLSPIRGAPFKAFIAPLPAADRSCAMESKAPQSRLSSADFCFALPRQVWSLKYIETVRKPGLAGFPNHERQLESGMAHISGFERSQLLLLPEAIDDYVGGDNPVRFIDAFVDGLDLSTSGFERVAARATGAPATRRAIF